MASSSEAAQIYSPDASILITGASSGIGAAIAEHLADCGGRIALFARRADRLQALAHRLERTGAKPLVLVGDVTDPAVGGSGPRSSSFPPKDCPMWSFSTRAPEKTSRCRSSTRHASSTCSMSTCSGRSTGSTICWGRCSSGKAALSWASPAWLPTAAVPASGAYCASKAALSVLLESIRVEARPRRHPGVHRGAWIRALRAHSSQSLPDAVSDGHGRCSAPDL